MISNHVYEAEIHGKAPGNQYHALGMKTWKGNGLCVEFVLLKQNYIGPWPASVGVVFYSEVRDTFVALRLYSLAPESEEQQLKIEVHKEGMGYTYKETLSDLVLPTQAIQSMIEFPTATSIKVSTVDKISEVDMGFQPTEVTFNIVSSNGLISYGGGKCI